MDLLDSDTYKKLRRDPTTVVLKRTDFLISDLPWHLMWRLLWCSEALLPRFYGLSKIHKAELPTRPIVNTIGSPTYYLVKHLIKLLWLYIW